MQNLDPPLNVTGGAAAPNTGPNDPISRLENDRCGNSVAALADEVVARHGSPTLQWLNRIFDRWRKVWDCRCSRDFKQENRTFSADPVRFWWLAKLYLALHFDRSSILKSSDFAVLDAVNGPEDDAKQLQLKILRLLLGFRQRKEDLELSKECYLSSVVGSADDASVDMPNSA